MVKHYKDPSPDPETIRDWRRENELSASAAAELVHTSQRSWLQWEAGDRKMHPAFWELAQLKLLFLESPATARPILAAMRSAEAKRRAAQRAVWHATKDLV